MLFSCYKLFHSNNISTLLHLSFSTWICQCTALMQEYAKYNFEENLAYSRSHPAYWLSWINVMCALMDGRVKWGSPRVYSIGVCRIRHMITLNFQLVRWGNVILLDPSLNTRLIRETWQIQIEIIFILLKTLRARVPEHLTFNIKVNTPSSQTHVFGLGIHHNYTPLNYDFPN